MSYRIQELIHHFEMGAGRTFVKVLAASVAFVSLAVIYHLLCFRNLSNPDAMDAAQLARNIADGRGFTTLNIRPLSVHLCQKYRTDHSPRLNEPHPDLANAPVYPVLLAGLMKAFPVPPNDAVNPGFGPSLGDRQIAIFNQFLFGVALILLFLLGRQLFDDAVAWIATGLFAGGDLFWRFSISGLNTMLLIVLFLALAWCLVAIERIARNRVMPLRPTSAELAALSAEAQETDRRAVNHLRWWSILAGLTLAALALTRYSMVALLVPTILFVAWFAGRGRSTFCVALVGTFLVLYVPWLIRNTSLSGYPYGISTMAAIETTFDYPGERLQRSLNPTLALPTTKELSKKFLTNARQVVTERLPKIGGGYVCALFLVGLLIPFRNPASNRFRWCTVLGLVVLVPVEALGATFLSVENPDVNSENQLVVLAPLVLLFGAGLMMSLCHTLGQTIGRLKIAVASGVFLIACSPLAFTLLPPAISPLNYPPYLPKVVQWVGDLTEPDELVMSDIPWAVAWYGRRQAIWIPQNWNSDFTEVHVYLKPVRVLYLTRRTSDGRFMADWVQGENFTWGMFVLECVMRREVPTGFPLRQMPEGFFPEQLVLTDRKRWTD